MPRWVYSFPGGVLFEKVLDFIVRTIYNYCADDKGGVICPHHKDDRAAKTLRVNVFIFVSPQQKKQKYKP